MNELYIHATLREISVYVNGSRWNNPEHFTVEEVSNNVKTITAHRLGTAKNIDIPVSMPFRFTSPVAAISSDPLVVDWMRNDAGQFMDISPLPNLGQESSLLWSVREEKSTSEEDHSMNLSKERADNLLRALECQRFGEEASFDSTHHALLLRTQRVFRRIVELIQRETYNFHQREIVKYKKAFPLDGVKPHDIVDDISRVYGVDAHDVLSHNKGLFVQSNPDEPLVASYDKAFRQTLMADGSFMTVAQSHERRMSFCTISYLSSPVKRFDVRLHVFDRKLGKKKATSSIAERHGLDAARYMIHPKAQNITVLCDSNDELNKFTQRHDIAPERPVKCRKIKGHGESNSANVYGQMNLMADKLAQKFNRMELSKIEEFDEFQLYVVVRRALLDLFPHWKDAEFSCLLTHGTLPQLKPAHL